jgi:hypothetical protein
MDDVLGYLPFGTAQELAAVLKLLLDKVPDEVVHVVSPSGFTGRGAAVLLKQQLKDGSTVYLIQLVN